MILADSSVWIGHFRGKEPRLAALLTEDRIVTHPYVVGELALGHLKSRNQVLHDLQLIPRVSPATDKETLEWIERRRLFGRGIGWVDAHILLSCVLNHAELWTLDRPLASVARSCGLKPYA